MRNMLCLYLFNLWNGIYYWRTHLYWMCAKLNRRRKSLVDPPILSFIMLNPCWLPKHSTTQMVEPNGNLFLFSSTFPLPEIHSFDFVKFMVFRFDISKRTASKHSVNTANEIFQNSLANGQSIIGLRVAMKQVKCHCLMCWMEICQPYFDGNVFVVAVFGLLSSYYFEHFVKINICFQLTRKLGTHEGRRKTRRKNNSTLYCIFTMKIRDDDAIHLCILALKIWGKIFTQTVQKAILYAV